MAARGFRGVAGTQTDCIVFGADAPTITTTEGYDGTNWSTRPSLATARGDAGGTGTSSAALCFGQVTKGQNTEEFTGDTATETASTIDFD